MGRLRKEKIDVIKQLREEGFTQVETAEKVNVHLRTVRKYDPLKKRKPIISTVEQDIQLEETCNELVVEGLLHRASYGRFYISSLGKKTFARWHELRQRAILEFMAEAGRPVKEEEITEYLVTIHLELFNQALDEVKRR